MNSPSPPPPPDPYKTAAAQTGTNISTAIAQQGLNQTNQVTPYGSLTYSQTGYQTIKDPATGKTYQVPQSTATQTLSPEEQAIFNNSTNAQKQYGTIANAQLGRVGGILSDPLDLSAGAITAHTGDLWHSGLDPVWAQNQTALESQLANKGIQVGSTAYGNAMDDFNRQKGAAYNDALLRGQGQSVQEMLAARNQPLNETAALMSGSQVQSPNFINAPQTGVGAANIEGDVNSSYAAQMQAYQQQQASQNGMIGSIAQMAGTLGGAALGGPMGAGIGKTVAGWALSDPRAKTDKRRVGGFSGMGIYKFRYKGSPFQQMGLMADEVEKVLPEAVRTRSDGLREVNYGTVADAV